MLYHANDVHGDQTRTHETRRLSAAVYVRTTAWRIPEMAISDRRAAIVLANSADPDTALVKTDQPEAISVLTVLFDQAWNTATPPPPASSQPIRGRHRELASVELRLLALLAAGATDETAARQLGISIRTARRHMATLMDRLAATAADSKPASKPSNAAGSANCTHGAPSTPVELDDSIAPWTARLMDLARAT